MVKNPLGGTGPSRKNRTSGRFVTTRSGKTLKINRNLGQKLTAMKEAKALRKVNRLRGLPKSRLRRLAWRMHPKRLAAYWFSRDGGIMALKVLGITILSVFVLTLAVFAYFRKDLPDISISGTNLGGSISYYDRTGKTLLWQDYNRIKRYPTTSSDIAPIMKEATVAVEDRDFYNHKGFDVKGIVRAGLNDIFHRGSTQGGSTITQQLVKISADWSQQRTFSRKVKELILAVELERSYTKDEILTGYLNAAPYGSLDYGVKTAASDYFHKDPKDLTLPEAAMLAAIPKSPTVYSPYSGDYFDKQAFIGRYNYVIDSLLQTGKITQKQAAAAKKTDVLAEVQPQQTLYAGIKAPYFVLAAKDEVLQRCSGTNGSCAANVGGWKVITSLDLTMQDKADQVAQSNIANIHRYGADEEATVIEDVKTAQMLAVVGGVDFTDPDHGQINYAHDVKISPGSSFKPYDYSTLIDNHTDAGAGSVLYDSQGPIPGYICTNKSKPVYTGSTLSGGNCLEDYDFSYPGPLTLRYALGGSRNVPAVKAMLEAVPSDTSPTRATSVNKVISTADALMSAPGAYQCYTPGVDINQAKQSDQTQCYGASAIGDGAYLHLDQHVNGVASLARLGASIPSTYLLEIDNSAGKPIYKWTQPKPTQVVKQDTAYIVDNMTSDPNASYLPAGYYKWHRYNGWTTSIKTGTTNNGFDGLEMAWNTQYAVGSWVGYHTRNKSLSGTMELLTTPLTRGLMTYALDSLHTTPVTWTEPSDIQHLPAYVVSHKVSRNGEVVPSPGTDIFPSWYKQKSANNQNVTIDKVSNKIATNCTPDLAKQNLGGSAAPNSFSIDEFYPPGSSATASSANTSASDDVHSCSDARPSISLTAPSACTSTCTFTATATQGTHPLNDAQYPQFPGTINFLVNGQVVKTITFSDPSVTTQSFDYTPTGNGTGTVTAQVIDSVLYDSTSDPASVVFATAPSGPTGFSVNKTGSTLHFTWSDGVEPFTVFRVIGSGGVPVGGSCTSTPASSCSAPASGGSATYYVQDNDGNKSNQAGA